MDAVIYDFKNRLKITFIYVLENIKTIQQGKSVL